MKVLDIGCGKGNSLDNIKFIGWGKYWFKNKSDYYIGIDIDENALKDARKNGYDVIRYDLESGRLPFKDEIFDRVLAQDILEHLHSHIEIRNETYRVLKPRGMLYVKVPCETSPNLWRDYAHKRGYTEQSIKKFLKDGGFVIQKFKIYKRTALLTINPVFAIKSLMLVIISKILNHDYTTYSYHILCSKSE
ncbi:MAG: class I SAM-dependent methyltransferase [Methanocellales archaeon]|nr:class I SAM-dependent methyltransferase [Methanocellales archaeon]